MVANIQIFFHSHKLTTFFHFFPPTGETASNTAAEMKTRKAEMMEMDWMPIPAHTQKRMKVSTNATKAALMMKFLIVSIS